MLAFTLDTNVCMRVLRDRPAGLRARSAAERERLCISTIVVAELVQGAAKSARPEMHRSQVDQFTARLAVLPLDQAAAAHAGDIRTDLERRGCVIGVHELLIGGHARSRGLVLITGNPREFRRFDGLRCEDWLAP